MKNDPIYDRVVKRFRGRCIFPITEKNQNGDTIVLGLCFKPYTDVHEIEFKSKLPGKWNTLENRVTLCKEHHNFMHERPKIAKYLVELGVKHYLSVWSED